LEPQVEIEERGENEAEDAWARCGSEGQPRQYVCLNSRHCTPRRSAAIDDAGGMAAGGDALERNEEQPRAQTQENNDLPRAARPGPMRT